MYSIQYPLTIIVWENGNELIIENARGTSKDSTFIKFDNVGITSGMLDLLGYGKVSYRDLKKIRKCKDTLWLELEIKAPDGGASAHQSLFVDGDNEVSRIVMNKIKSNTKNSNSKMKIENSKPILNGKLGTVIVVVLVIIIAIVISNKMNSGTTEKWDRLSDEEKEWYEDNYGDGKMDDINEAIDDYENQ